MLHLRDRGERAHTTLGQELAPCCCGEGREGRAVPGTGLSSPRLPGGRGWGLEGLELCSTGSGWSLGLALMWVLYK